MEEDILVFSTSTELISEVIVKKLSPWKFWTGVGLAVSSSIFIGGSFIVKKIALIKESKLGKKATDGGHGYLKNPLWWIGLLTMAIGEIANFVAYAFAPASLVATLGVLSVLVATILSSIFLKERLNFLGKLGCFLCSVGSIIIVLHAPDEDNIENMDELKEKILEPIFLTYVGIISVSSLVLIYYFRPKYSVTSTRVLLIWIGVCSMIGSLSVMFSKSVGIFFIGLYNSTEKITNSLFWICVLLLLFCISVQMNFLNKALDGFNTAIVTPIYYVLFTSFVLIASSILFQEFKNLQIEDWTGLTCGFLVVLSAIFLLHFCKNQKFNFKELASKITIEREEELEGADLMPQKEEKNEEIESDKKDNKLSNLYYGSI